MDENIFTGFSSVLSYFKENYKEYAIFFECMNYRCNQIFYFNQLFDIPIEKCPICGAPVRLVIEPQGFCENCHCYTELYIEERCRECMDAIKDFKPTNLNFYFPIHWVRKRKENQNRSDNNE